MWSAVPARAGLAAAGAHRLRHHAATAMLAGGASLAEVGQVLRHARSLPPTCMPRLTGWRCAALPSPGREVPGDRAAPGGPRLHRGAPRAGFQAPAPPRAAGELHRLPGGAGATTITTELALSWATLPGDDAHPAYLSNRLCAVRGFARHLQAFDPATEVPPAGAPLAQMPGHPLPVLRRRHRCADDARPARSPRRFAPPPTRR